MIRLNGNGHQSLKQMEEEMKKTLVLLLVALLSISFVFANGSKETVSEVSKEVTARAGKTVYVALSENLISLDPLDQANIIGNMQANLVCEPLVWWNEASNEYLPCLATDWSVSDDGLVWTFNLRKGVKFQNGEDFNAADCALTYQRLLDNRTTLNNPLSYWQFLEGYNVVDDYTFQIIMKEPYATTLLSVFMTPIMPNEAFEQYGTKLWTDYKLVGTGPWKFEEWVDGQYCSYSKNENYWDESYDSYYDKLVLRYIMEPSTSVASHLVGDTNVNIASGGINPDMLQLYNGSENTIDMIKMVSGTFLYGGFSFKEGSPFNDYNVRAAFDYAIDRQSIVDNILGGGKVPNSTIVEGCIGYNPNLQGYKYDPELAKEYLKKSSYDGRKIVLSCNTSMIKGEAILLAMSDMLNAVGFNTSVSVVEVATLSNMRKTGDYDVFFVANMHIGNDPGTCLSLRILNDAHHSFYKNQELFNLISASSKEVDAEKRAEMLQQIAALIDKNKAPHSAIAQVNLNYAADKGIQGMELYASGWFNIKHIDFVSVK